MDLHYCALILYGKRQWMEYKQDLMFTRIFCIRTDAFAAGNIGRAGSYPNWNTINKIKNK
jgi:hypothetical protein